MANQSDKKNLKNKNHKVPYFMAAIGTCTLIRLVYLIRSFFGEDFSSWELLSFGAYLAINLFSFSNIAKALESGIPYSYFD
jgi:hypothetical protein